MFGTPEIDTALSRWMHFAIALQGHFAQSTFFYCSRWNGDERRGHLRYSAHLDLLAACLGYPALFALRLFQGCSGIRASCHFQTRSSLGRWLQRTWYTICFAKPIKKLHEFVMTSTVAQAHFQQILQNDGGLELWTLFPSLSLPGIFFVLPCIESYQKVDLRTITLGVPPQEVWNSILFFTVNCLYMHAGSSQIRSMNHSLCFPSWKTLDLVFCREKAVIRLLASPKIVLGNWQNNHSVWPYFGNCWDMTLIQVLTRDSVTVSVDAVVYYRVSNATVSVANVENAHHSTRLLAQTTLRNILGTKSLHEILSDRESISSSMQVIQHDVPRGHFWPRWNPLSSRNIYIEATHEINIGWGFFFFGRNF